MTTRKNDTLYLYVALDNVTLFEAAELDAIALLADTGNDDLDPEVSAQLVQASAHACLSFGKDKGKAKARARADTLFDRHICRWRTDDG